MGYAATMNSSDVLQSVDLHALASMITAREVEATVEDLGHANIWLMLGPTHLDAAGDTWWAMVAGNEDTGLDAIATLDGFTVGPHDPVFWEVGQPDRSRAIATARDLDDLADQIVAHYRAHCP